MKRLLLLLVMAAVAAPAAAQSPEARLVLLPDTTGPQISRHMYGLFAEHLGRDIYDGFWVGEGARVPHVRGIRKDIVDALNEVGIPNIRWPGGCFADIYHWRDGVGPRAQRPAVPNRFWGHVLEDNSFGTHEFMDLAEQLGAEPYLAGNVGSGTVQEMSDWVEYLKASDESPMAKLRREHGRQDPWEFRFFGVGNESWGCGGNMRAQFYADLYRQYATYLRQYAQGLYLIAAGPSAGYGGYGSDLEWTDILMRDAGRMMDGYSLHYYTVTHNWTTKGSATLFDESEWMLTLKKSTWVDSVITAHASVMDRYDPEQRIAIVFDEWGTWHDGEPGTPGWALYQQNTLRDALVAGITLNSFNNHADRVRVANLAQTVNVLQALVLTEEDAGRMLLTPTYDVFHLFRPHHDAELIPSVIEGPEYQYGGERMPALTASSSRGSDGSVTVTLTNADTRRAIPVSLPFEASDVSGMVVTADELNAHNTFDDPDRLRRAAFGDIEIREGEVVVTLPPRSVVAVTMR